MDKKLLIYGSILAIVVLVLAGISPVVGYNTVQAYRKDSPLFGVRTQRALEKESDRLTCDYIGKESIMLFPTRDPKAILLKRAINLISSMNKRGFNNFLISLINHMKIE